MMIEFLLFRRVVTVLVLGWLAVAFLNLCHILRLSWALLLAPLWIPAATCVVVVLVVWIGGCALGLADWFQRLAERRQRRREKHHLLITVQSGFFAGRAIRGTRPTAQADRRH